MNLSTVLIYFLLVVGVLSMFGGLGSDFDIVSDILVVLGVICLIASSDLRNRMDDIERSYK